MAYELAQSMYVYKHGKDIEVTITDIEKYSHRDEITFVDEGKIQNIEIDKPLFGSRLKVGDIVRVRKCENIDRYVHSSPGGLVKVLLLLIFSCVFMLLCSLPIWYALYCLFATILMLCLHHSPFRYSRLAKWLKQKNESQYDIVIVDNVKYEKLSDSTCMVIGCCGDLKDAVIPNEVVLNGARYRVTDMRSECFKDCKSLTSISLPDSVTSLGNSCFSGCVTLKNINLPAPVTMLGDSCFSRCESLTSISLPDSVTSLGNSCFTRCESLTSISLPDSITSLGNSCFSGCVSLRNINLPASITMLGDSCFSSCASLSSIDLPNSITRLGRCCFEDCSSLSSIKLPERIFNVDLGKCPYTVKYKRILNLNIFAVNTIIDSLNKETGCIGYECFCLTGIGEKYCEISVSYREVTKMFVYKITELPDKVKELKSVIDTL